MRLFFDLCISIEGSPGETLQSGLELGTAPCRDAETGNFDQRWLIDPDGTIFSPDTQMCPVSGPNGFIVDYCTGNDLKWTPDPDHRLRNIDDPSLCLTINHPSEPWQRPQGWSGLVLEPCGDRADQMWRLPGMETWIFTDGFESGKTAAWQDLRQSGYCGAPRAGITTLETVDENACTQDPLAIDFAFVYVHAG